MIDPRVVATAFSALFLAEMGDKTQLAVLALSGSSGRPLSVFIGAVAALSVVTAIGALAGGALGRYVAPQLVNRAAGAAFIAIGIWMWVGARAQ